MNNLNKKIGLYLRALRKERGLTEKELGILLNLSQQQISRYETGTTKITFQLMDKIFFILHISWRDFFKKIINDEL